MLLVELENQSTNEGLRVPKDTL